MQSLLQVLAPTCRLMAVLSLAAPSVAAPPPKELKVETASLVVLAGGGEQLGVERTVSPGDLIMQTGIGVEDAGLLDQSIMITAAGLTRTLPRQEMLVGATVLDGTVQGRVYCAAPEKPPKISVNQTTTEKGRRFRSTVKFCLVDSRKTGMLDKAFVVGALWPEDSGLMDIAPTAYSPRTDFPLPDSYFRVTFEKGALLQGPIVHLAARVQGQPVDLAFAKIGPDRKALKKYDSERTIKQHYPYMMPIGDAAITLTDYQPADRKLRLRVDKPFETRLLDFQMIVRTLFIYY